MKLFSSYFCILSLRALLIKCYSRLDMKQMPMRFVNGVHLTTTAKLSSIKRPQPAKHKSSYVKLLNSQREVLALLHEKLKNVEKEKQKLQEENEILRSRLERSERRCKAATSVEDIKHVAAHGSKNATERFSSNDIAADVQSGSSKQSCFIDSSFASSSSAAPVPFAAPIVPTPGWRKLEDGVSIHKRHCVDAGEFEKDLDDGALNKRHQKFEADEKRIKKNDARRIREEEKRRSLQRPRTFIAGLESLLQTTSETNRNGSKSFVPTDNDIKSIESIIIEDHIPGNALVLRSKTQKVGDFSPRRRLSNKTATTRH